VASAVEFRHATKRFGVQPGGGPAVDDLSLSVPAGEICVLVGPSGCGKTTALKMVNRLVEPTSGQVLLDGEDVMKGDVVALRRRIGYVIQQIGLFPHQTIEENVATVPLLLKWPRERVVQRVDELLRLVGLDPAQMGRRYPAQLSGGERQRVGVARALAAEPPLLLMDEPFGAVDPIVRARLQDEFLRIQRQLRTTVLFVTHDIDEAIKVGDRVAVLMAGGRLAQYSPPAELLARPASDYVAQFVGSDRTLKRLALIPVTDLRLEPVDASAHASAPRIPREANARQALATLLAAPDGRALVVDGNDSALGTLSLYAVGAALRDTTPSPLTMGQPP
jgi:osmoprotectant transport system ATP-binding protein